MHDDLPRLQPLFRTVGWVWIAKMPLCLAVPAVFGLRMDMLLSAQGIFSVKRVC
jgi:hypothetical protein